MHKENLRTHNTKWFYASILVVIIAAFTVLGARADTVATDFEGFTLGSVNGQDGWSMTGSYDVAVVNNTYGYTSFGSKSLRISNAATSGSFGDQTFSKSLVNEAGETTADNGGMSGGTRQTYFEASWDFASTVPGSEQVGLSITASPDRGDGARMSWIQMADTSTGLAVNFYDFEHQSPADCNYPGPSWRYTELVNNLDRTKPHNIKVTMQFIDGINNDIVKVYIDGNLVHTGLSWEDYFVDCESNPSRTVDSLLFRASGTAASGTSGNGFLIDNVQTFSGIIPSTVVVSGNNMNGWWIYEEVASARAGFAYGPATPPLGKGSAFIETIDDTNSMLIGTLNYAGTRLDAISTLQYSTYQDLSTDANLATTLQLHVDYDVTDANTAWQGRLVFEPYNSGTVTHGVWQTWDALAGKWWASGAPGNTVCPIGSPCTWAEVLSNFPNAGIWTGNNGQVLFKGGDTTAGNWVNFLGYVDNFQIAVDGSPSTNTIYDFEPTCALVQGNTYTFSPDAGSANTVTVDVQTLGTIDCMVVNQTNINHPDATANMTDPYYWTLTAYDSSGNAASGYSLDLTFPHQVGTEPKACYSPGALGGYGWDCTGTQTDNGTTVTREAVDHLSDWAIGYKVGPTAINLTNLNARQSNSLVLPVVLAAVILSFAGIIGLRRKRA